jgi:hypothetical protein
MLYAHLCVHTHTQRCFNPALSIFIPELVLSCYESSKGESERDRNMFQGQTSHAKYHQSQESILKGPIHDQSCCAKLFCATQVCPFMIKSVSTIHDQSCCTTRSVAQHDWSCMGYFTSRHVCKWLFQFKMRWRRKSEMFWESRQEQEFSIFTQ